MSGIILMKIKAKKPRRVTKKSKAHAFLSLYEQRSPGEVVTLHVSTYRLES